VISSCRDLDQACRELAQAIPVLDEQAASLVVQSKSRQPGGPQG
jgi:hypothetical protein